MDDYAKFVLDRAKQAGMKPSQLKPEPVAEAAPVAAPKAEKKKSGPSPSTLRHAVKKAEEEMARLTADLARIDTDLAAAAAANDSKKLESLGRARAKTQADLDAAETAWIAAEEALAEVA